MPQYKAIAEELENRISDGMYRPTEPLPKFKEIAEEFGVSNITVIKALDALEGRGLIDRHRGKAIYVRALESGRRPRTHSIGVVIPDVANPFFGSMAKSIQGTLHEHGFQVISQGTEGSLALWNQHLRRFIADGVDGLVIAPADSDKPEREKVLWQLKLANIPFVYLNTAFKRVPSDYVVVDLASAVRLAAGHLIELGHRRIGCISAQPFRKETEYKVDVLRERLAQDGIELRDCDVVIGDARHDEGGHEAALRLLDRAGPPTAIFATNDIIAMGAIHAARDLGLRVPEDVSLVGLDNIEVGRLSVPRLTTVGQPIDAMARRAAEILLQRVSGELDHDFVEVVVQPELIVRDSTQAP